MEPLTDFAHQMLSFQILHEGIWALTLGFRPSGSERTMIKDLLVNVAIGINDDATLDYALGFPP
jgi:hypothetical protein